MNSKSCPELTNSRFQVGVQLEAWLKQDKDLSSYPIALKKKKKGGAQ
jgi:hypothetical protein